MPKVTFEDFTKRIPEEYRKNIISTTGVSFKDDIEYKNPGCGHISNSRLSGFVRRKQFEFCVKCAKVENYIERLPDEYRSRVKYLDNNRTINAPVVFEFGCGHEVETTILLLLKKKSLDLCNSCKKFNLTKKEFLERIPEEYHKNIEVDKWNGYSTVIKYNHSCGHSVTTRIGTFANRTQFDVCKDCFIPNVISEDEIKSKLDPFLNEVKIHGSKIDQDIIVSGTCSSCNNRVENSYCNLRLYYKKYNKPQCSICSPKSFYQSELYSFIKTICDNDITYNDRSVIKINSKQSEIDIYIDELKFGIEFNGVVWHSNKYKSRNYHYNKTKACIEQGITLLHVWDDKYISKREIYHSIIKSKLGKIDNKIFARKTDLKELSKKQIKEFFEANHLDGNVGCMTGWGLFYKDQLVQAVSIRKVNSQNKKYKNYIEIARSASLIDHLIIGGESKLLNYVEKFAVSNSFDGILNYVSCDFGGIQKKKWKFKFQGVTGISYFYTDTHKRVSRQNLQRRNGKSEKELAEEAGLLRVDGTPNLIYTRSFKDD